MAPKKAVLRALTIGQPNAGETMSDRIRRVRSEMQRSGDRASVIASALPPLIQTHLPPPRAAIADPVRPTPKRQRVAPSGDTRGVDGRGVLTVTGKRMRSDEPAVLYTRRGSASGAISSLQRNGLNALEASLRQDRVARSSLAPTASVQKTGHQLHRASDRSGGACSGHQRR